LVPQEVLLSQTNLSWGKKDCSLGRGATGSVRVKVIASTHFFTFKATRQEGFTAVKVYQLHHLTGSSLEQAITQDNHSLKHQVTVSTSGEFPLIILRHRYRPLKRLSRGGLGKAYTIYFPKILIHSNSFVSLLTTSPNISNLK